MQRATTLAGDVNSTLACALTAAKLGIAVGHLEAGLRSFDRSIPEEINGVLTDHMSELLVTSEKRGNQNLLREGISQAKVHFPELHDRLASLPSGRGTLARAVAGIRSCTGCLCPSDTAQERSGGRIGNLEELRQALRESGSAYGSYSPPILVPGNASNRRDRAGNLQK